MATIDVLMPVRNGIGLLGESIESITGQAYANWRLLVFDHGSSDGSAEPANIYADRKLRSCLIELLIKGVRYFNSHLLRSATSAHGTDCAPEEAANLTMQCQSG